MNSINQWGREHPNETDQPEGNTHVPVTEATEHGFWGRQIDDDNQRMTVAGVVADDSHLTGPGVETHGLPDGGGTSESSGSHAAETRTTRGRGAAQEG
jgi:hypothetical protein